MLVPLGVWLACAAAYGAVRPRVIGGTDDAQHRFPYAVTLEMEATKWTSMDYTVWRYCSGSLITQTWVLTAAHCIQDRKVNRVRYGDFEKLQNETTKLTKILKFVPHPNYIKFDNTFQFIMKNDIGLARVEPVPSPALATLSAVDYRSLVGQRAELAGFSRFIQLNPLSLLETRPLQVLEVIMIRCKGYDLVLEGRKAGPSICVQSKCGEASIPYKGDSGGPLVHDGRVVGVCSFGDPRKFIEAYTPVSPYLSWIQEIVSS